MQISQEAGKVVWYSHLLKNFPQFAVMHTAKGFGMVSEAEVDVFLEFSCFFDDPMDVGNLISGSSAFSKCNLNIWKFMVHILLKPGLENFEHDFTSIWDECNWVVVWAFFGIAFLWDWNENWPFPVLWKILSCGKFLKRWEYQTILHASWETCMQVKKQQLEPNMEQQTSSKLGKEYNIDVYCHSTYLTSMQSTSCKILGWMKHKLE